jgi:hypothetical protein
LRACFCPRNTSEGNSESLLFYEYFCFSERNSELFFLPRNGSEQNSKCLLLFLFHGTEFLVVFTSVEWFRMEFPECAFIFVPRYRIPSISLLCRKVWNRSPRVFCSAEQPEFRRNKSIVLSIPSSAEFFFCRKFPTLVLAHTALAHCSERGLYTVKKGSRVSRPQPGCHYQTLPGRE